MFDPALVPALNDVLMVARTGSVAAAATRLHKTPSAVSQQLRRVKEHFGIELFVRAGRSLRLSAHGEAALGAVQRLFDEAESLFGFLAALSGNPTATLRVAVSEYIGKRILLPVLRELLVNDAPLRFEIITMHSLDAPRSVVRGEVDFAVVTTMDPNDELAEHVLLTQPFVWVAPRIRSAKKRLPSRLSTEPVLRLAKGSLGRKLLDGFLEEHRIRPASTIDVPSVSLLLSYVSGGLGVGLAPALALTEVPRSRVVTEPAAVPALPVKLVHRSNYRLTKPVEFFVERVVAEGRRAADLL